MKGRKRVVRIEKRGYRAIDRKEKVEQKGTAQRSNEMVEDENRERKGEGGEIIWVMKETLKDIHKSNTVRAE